MAPAPTAAATPPHLLLVPFPAQGHALPLFDLAALLAARGLRLTVVTTPANAGNLAPLLAAHPNCVHPLTLPFPSHPSLPAGLENTKNCPPVYFAVFIHALAALRRPVLAWAKGQSEHPVVAVVSDFFCGWTQPLAAELGIPRIVFTPSGVLGTAVPQSLFRRLVKRPVERDDGFKVTFPAIPGEPAYQWRELSMVYRTYIEGLAEELAGESQSLKQNYLWNLESWGFVSNTFRALEGRYLDTPLEDLRFRHVWAVGPLAPDTDAAGERGGKAAVAAGNLSAWLDTFPEGSVVYVCFGSQAVQTPAVAAALAEALERSAVPFVWVVSQDGVVPEDFEARAAAAKRGMVVRGWAPQVAVLRHAAVGWFMTHCGWNSVLEAVAAGVPMLAWPMSADQFVNARLLVEEAGVAVRACAGGLFLNGMWTQQFRRATRHRLLYAILTNGGNPPSPPGGGATRPARLGLPRPHARMNLGGTLAATAPRHEMPLKPSSFLLSSSLRRSLLASVVVRKVSPTAAAALSPMASASTVAAENGAAKPTETQPVQVAKRLEKFKTTIFTQMSMLAIKHGAINLGQGFPNFDGPDFVKEAAIQAINAGKNQYARGYGVPELNSAIAERFLKDSGLQVDPEKEVTVTSGCTEAIAATILGLINPGDEVILFAPFYDSYEATLSMAGANVKAITLRPPDFSVPLEELKAAVSKNTRAIMINTPHNPTGKMFTREELEFIAALCKENDVLLFADEVYDKLAFEADHISMASIPGMYERTVTMNSLGKTFSLTGWKIGWAIAPPHLTWGVRQAHSFLTFATCTPMQAAAAAALRAPDSYYEELRRDYGAKKALLVNGLKDAGFIVYPSSGTYFIMVDHTPFGFDNDIEFCEYLIREVGVVAIPPSVFYLNPEDGKNLVRFTFCKDDETLRAAVERMKTKLKKK